MSRPARSFTRSIPPPSRRRSTTPRPPWAGPEANLPALQSRADRYKEALADKAVAQQDLDDATAALKQAEADIAYYQAMVETARINLGYTHVVSPISGRIGRSTVTDGAIVTAYQPLALATIQQLDPIYVDVPQSTTELLRLQRRLAEKQMNRDGTNANQVELILEDGTKYPSGRDPGIPRRLGGSDHRVRDLADGFPQSERGSPAGDVRSRGGEGRRQ